MNTEASSSSVLIREAVSQCYYHILLVRENPVLPIRGLYEVTMLREPGVTVDGPYSHEWMPARSIYFADPDGHDLELCAPVNRK